MSKRLNRRARRALAYAATPPPPVVEPHPAPGAARRVHLAGAGSSLVGLALVWMESAGRKDTLAELAAGAERVTVDASPAVLGGAGVCWALHLLVLLHRPLRKLRARGAIVLGVGLTALLAGWIVGERQARSLHAHIRNAGYHLCDTSSAYRGPTRYHFVRTGCDTRR